MRQCCEKIYWARARKLEGVAAIDKTKSEGEQRFQQHHNHTYRRTSLSTSGGGRRGCISHAEAIRGFAGLHVSGKQEMENEVRHHAKHYDKPGTARAAAATTNACIHPADTKKLVLSDLYPQ